MELRAQGRGTLLLPYPAISKLSQSEKETRCLPFCLMGRIFLNTEEVRKRNSLAVQWLGLDALTAEGPGLIPGWRTKIPQAVRHGQKKKKVRKKRNQHRDKNPKLDHTKDVAWPVPEKCDIH